jgi:carboxypeptidase Q
MSRTLKVALLCLALLHPYAAYTQDQGQSQSSTPPLIALDIQEKIRKEGTENSSIMRTMHYLTDVYGPRLTGSPNLKAAGEWAIKQMAEWGFENGNLDPWDFGHQGWTNERLTAHIVSPIKEPLTCEVMAWTPSTNGTVTAQVLQIVPPNNPTQEELRAYLDRMKDSFKGKIVMVGKPMEIAVNLTPPPKRIDDQVAKDRFSDKAQPLAGGQPNQQQNQQTGQTGQTGQMGQTGQQGQQGQRGQQAQQGQGQGQQAQQAQPPRLNRRRVSETIDAYLLANGALLRIDDGGRDHRQIRAFNNPTFDPAKVLPTVYMSNEDYGRISRIMAGGTPVELEFTIVNRLHPEGKTAYNVISEIPGLDKKDEVIMLGGHLDSWHAATGATDNAIGCAVMMEAARILKAIGLKPRRTIRVALWSGEEQGLLGSQAYVKKHFGSFEDPKPAYFKFGGYFNIDSGTGRARGMSVFGPPEAADSLRQALAPFADLGFFGTVALRTRNLGGSDHTSFNRAGLPGIGAVQDPIEYFTDTWHTNLDTYERIIEDDAKKSAIVIAAAIYHLAMRDDLLPRFSKEQMLPTPPTRQQ